MSALDDLKINPTILVPMIYAAGGTHPSQYGFISSGYGGGIDQDQYFEILYFQGYLDGVSVVNRPLYLQALYELNQALLAAYPDEINEGNVPFINLEGRRGY